MTKAELEILRTKLLSLPQSDRAALAKDLLESLDGPSEDAGVVTRAWEIEIYRRIKEVEAGKAELLDADEVLAQMRAQFRS